MDSLFFLVNPKQQTIQQASNFKTALELTFGSNITNIKESFEKDSKSKVFFDTGGIESNYFFRFNKFLFGGSCVIVTNKNKSEIIDLIKWIPASDARAELTCQSFLTEIELNSNGIVTERTGSLSFNVHL